MHRLLEDLFFESGIQIGNFIERIELWNREASSITNLWKYNAEKYSYSDILNALKVVDGRWFASESPHGGSHDEQSGENEFPDFLIQRDTAVFDFQLRKLNALMNVKQFLWNLIDHVSAGDAQIINSL